METPVLRNSTTESDFNNVSSNSSYYGHPALQGFQCVLYALIFLIGSSGNFLVCYVVVRNPSMHTVTNIFITNLAISDMCMCFLAVPFTPLSGFMDKWLFGSILCHIIPMVTGVSVFVSTLTLTAIAIDRFIVICFPFLPRMKMWVCVLVICIIWTVSISFSFPIGYFMVLTEDHDCLESWPGDDDGEHMKKLYTLASFVVQFIVPLCFITVCYLSISTKMSHQLKKKIGARSSKKEEQDIKRKKRMNIMLVAMVLIFASCWLPLNVANIARDYTTFAMWPYFLVTFYFIHIWAVSSTCYNPILYSWLNENFRKEFKAVLPCFPKTKPGQHRSNGRLKPSTHACNCNDDKHSTSDASRKLIKHAPNCAGSSSPRAEKSSKAIAKDNVLLQPMATNSEDISEASNVNV